MTALEAKSLYKIFGAQAEQVARRLEAGEGATSVSQASGTTAAVIDASFTVNSGEIFVVMGLSGSGKSTLIRMLNGLHPPTAGQVLIHGQDISAMSPEDLRRTRRDHISMVFQHFALFPHRTVLENAAYGLKIKGMPAAERTTKAREALDLVGLSGWGDRKPHQLSGGMQQRVGLARALAAQTDIMLMDEAFSALDPLIRRDMQDQLIDLQRQLGKTVVFITHDLNEAMRLGDRIAMMREGRIVQLGTAQEILSHPADEYVARFIADVDRSRVLTAEAIMEPAGDSPHPGAAEVPSTMLLADLVSHAARSPEPLRVVHEGQLLGVITREALLTALGHESELSPAGPDTTVQGGPR
ncbi:quaternary amine ABC transporter ATP-binding protein [Demetria terragena]|uniref:quaternary amine ABC transporter ATP-binding protein n=1 Tax=Demetria terragena TaxID=63959 RepID=UPI00035C511E|nr:glycine betaine/L-proline ABC transporter ATP-binding protein [Demetria terragena]